MIEAWEWRDPGGVSYAPTTDSPPGSFRVSEVASAKHLPASTLVRSWILERLDEERIA